MTGRVLTQVTISFLLGMIGSCYGSLWCYMIIGVWIVGLILSLYWNNRKSERKDSYKAHCGYGSEIKSIKSQQFIYENDVTSKLQKRNLATGAKLVWILLFLINLVFVIVGMIQYNEQQQIIASVEKYLTHNARTTVVGTIYKKEAKEYYHVYYLKNSYIIQSKDYQKCNQILIRQEDDTYSIGDTILVKGTCEKFNKASNEGNFDAESYYYSKNILFQMQATRITLIEKEEYLWRESLYQLRKRIQGVYNQYLPQEEAGVLGVMTLGEKSMLESEIKKLYQQSGISHVLAISGLHISILGMIIYQFLRKRRISYVSSGVIAGLLVFMFGEISGMELSTQRAVGMFCVMLLGNALGMAYDSVTALSLSALLQLWENPLVFRNTGFLFSYSAVLAVVVAAKIIVGNQEKKGEEEKADKNNMCVSTICWRHNYSEEDCNLLQNKISYQNFVRCILEYVGYFLNCCRKGIGETMITSSCIQLVTFPLTIYFYYEFPVYSILINGLLLPFMGFVLAAGVLGGMIGVFVEEFMGVGVLFLNSENIPKIIPSILEGIVKILLQIAAIFLKWNKGICELFQKLPKSTWITGQPSMKSMIGYYILLVLILRIIYQVNCSQENKKIINSFCKIPINVRLYVKPIGIAMLLVALVLLLSIRKPREEQICFLDVGQGDGIYIQTQEQVFFIDGGSTSEKGVGEYRILPFLKYRGVDQVDGWFVSHADADHISGLVEVLQSGYQVDTLFFTEKMVRDESWEELCTLANRSGTKIIYLAPRDCIETEEIKLICLFPWEEDDDKNAASMVLKLEMSGFVGIFTGDISVKEEQKLLEKYPQLQVDLYKAAHHGSNHSNSEIFLQQLHPKVTVVSCSEDNNYGHPGKDAVKRIKDAGSKIFYTMESGQVTVRKEKEELCVEEYKKQK